MKHEREEELRKQKLEAERRERERRRAVEQARVDRLLEAEQFKRAADIRAYIAAVRAAVDELNTPPSSEAVEAWAKWAGAQADRIDPVSSGASLDKYDGGVE